MIRSWAQRGRAMGLLVGGLVYAGCIVRIGEPAHISPPPGGLSASELKQLERCDYLRTYRDVLANTAAGTAVLAGAGGIAAIQFKDPHHQREVAAWSIVVGVVSAILTASSSSTGAAFSDESCKALFTKYSKGWGSGS